MHSVTGEARRRLPSISSVYRPIEEYWEASRTDGRVDAAAAEALDPLDAFLAHRTLELLPAAPTLVDAAIASTGGTSSLIGLCHPRVSGVWAVVDPESLQGQRFVTSLRDYLEDKAPGSVPLRLVDRSALPESLKGQRRAVILVDARAGDASSLAEEVGRWLDARPDALVLVLGLGRVGDCPVLASLLSLSAPGSETWFGLLRERGEVLMGSRLGFVARRDHPDIAVVLERLEHLYDGNYRYVDLLWRVNRAAMREAGIDEGILRNHSTFGPISQEIEDLKRAVREANERAAAAARELAAAEDAARPLSMLRRTLSPTPVGQVWRMAKRARIRLSPTPIGRAYRFTKRVALRGVSPGRLADRSVSGSRENGCQAEGSGMRDGDASGGGRAR